MTSPKGYSTPQIALHWGMAALIAGQYLFKDPIAKAWQAIRAGTDFAFDPLILAHVAGGGLLLALVIWRLALRLRHGAPPPPENEPAVLKTLSHLVHWAFYGLIAALSVTGLAAWFGDLVVAAQAHSVLKMALIALIALHLLAIPFHRIVLKNNVLARMLRPAA